MALRIALSYRWRCSPVDLRAATLGELMAMVRLVGLVDQAAAVAAAGRR